MILPDKIVRSSRKTIALIVNQHGKLIVRAPKRVSNQQIWAFIEQKQEWIAQKQAAVHERLSRTTSHAFAPGETFFYLGQSYALEITNTARPALTLVDGVFRLSSSAVPRGIDTFTSWYRERARVILEERVRLLAGQYQLKYQRVRISSARTRWGSCSSLGTLSFTWRLVMAPLPVIDYVIVHELAHLVEKNHSSRFWTKVAEMMPDYQAKRHWLKENASSLILE
jgi:predicted metal-dependent hydrolase